MVPLAVAETGKLANFIAGGNHASATGPSIWAKDRPSGKYQSDVLMWVRIIWPVCWEIVQIPEDPFQETWSLTEKERIVIQTMKTKIAIMHQKLIPR